MSSHHIVRDEQEPALLLWQPGQLSFEEVGQLLEWSPRVIAHLPALEEALGWGIKLDAVWAVPAALPQAQEAVKHQQPVLLHSFASEPGLEEVVQWLRTKNQLSINVLGDAAANSFELLRQAEPMQTWAQLQLISQGWRYCFFSKGTASKWFPQGSRLRCIAFGQQPHIQGPCTTDAVQTHGFQETFLEASGVITIKGPEAFWLGEQL